MINETKPPENLIIPLELAQAIGNYILSQPCQNVPVGKAYELIDALQRLQPAPQQPSNAAKENEHGN